MRKITLILIVLSLFSLVGCKKKEPILLGPNNVVFNEQTKVLSWDIDEGAINYKVLIDGVEVEVSTNSYDMSSYEHGQYKVRVRSIFKNRESNYSKQITVNVGTSIIIYVKDYKIYVTEIENARYSYSLRVDHNKVEGSNTTGIIDIPLEFQERGINFKLEIYINNVLRHEIKTTISLILNNTFRNKDLEILVNNPRAAYIDGEVIEATLLSDRLIIPKEKLNSLGSEAILAVSGDTYIIKRLYVTDPFAELISPQVISETDELKFTFDLHDFTFIEIAKEEFALGVDYFFNDGVLTFSDTFITKYKELFPESENIYLMAVFRRDTETVLINITIEFVTLEETPPTSKLPIIIGVTIGGLVVVIGATVTILLVKKRKNKH
ncbi:MAG: hypothetical protein ACOX02_02765 [Acholeplasmatales bacterium]